MCGIVGVRRFDGGFVSRASVGPMSAQLLHRGPDAVGAWSDDRSVAMGHTRLAIIDVNHSSQPMSSADGLIHLVFNGEIFNYQELRSKFSGYPFRTCGDTEVILAAYEAEGPACVDRLRGQFAFAIHDERTGLTHLFRDRLGVLPLYYVADRQFFAFASEIKALMPVLAQPTVDEESLDDYLAHRVVPAPHTLIRGVRKVLPSHHLVVDSRGNLRSNSYWTIPNTAKPETITIQKAVDQVDHALRSSIRDALVADVPVGIYLSGGVDSSLIAAMVLREREHRSLNTFAATFGAHSLDERYWSDRVSAALGTTHFQVEVNPADFIQDWGKLSWFRDGPLSEPADVAMYRLACLARQHVKVVLTGEGSDELFAGYPKHVFASATQWSGVEPLRALLGHLERRLPPTMARVRVAVRALSERDEGERMRAWFGPFTSTERATLLQSIACRKPLASPARGAGDALQRMLYADMLPWLSDNLLERGDRMSMAASLETRPPFLDYRLVELAFSLPSRFKVRHGRTKWILKEVARRYLPADVVDRPKVGFKVPLNLWFRGPLRDYAHDRLTSSSSVAGSVLSRRAVLDILNSHAIGRRNEETRIWTLLSLDIWHQELITRGVLLAT